MLLIWNEKNLFNIKLIDYSLNSGVYTCHFIYEPINKFFNGKKQKPFSVYFKRFWDLKRYAIKNKIDIDLITKKPTLLVNKKEKKEKISSNLKQAYQNFKNSMSYKEFKYKLWFISTAKKQNTIKVNNTTKKKDLRKDNNFNISKQALWL